MSFRERKVKGFVFDGDGNPFPNSNVKFQPTANIGFTNTHFIINKPFTAETDENGLFEITLWCDEDSNVAINWNVFFPKEPNGEPAQDYVKNFSLAYGDGSEIDLGYLIALNSPAPAPGDLLYQAVDERIATAIAQSGAGDMTKSEYDTDGDGIVDQAVIAENADKLGDVPAASYQLKPVIKTVSGTSYNLLESDNYKILRFTNAAGVTVNVPPGIAAPFFALLESVVSTITVAAGSGVTISQTDKSVSATKAATIYSTASNIFKLQGATE